MFLNIKKIFNNLFKKRVNQIPDTDKNSIIKTKKVKDIKIEIPTKDIKEFISTVKNEDIELTNIHLNSWLRLNNKNISKFTENNKEEFIDLFYKLMSDFKEYNIKNDIDIINKWESEESIVNDISFIIRYSENLIRRKFGNKRMLKYDLIDEYEKLSSYFDEQSFKLINGDNTLEGNCYEIDVEKDLLNGFDFETYFENKNLYKSDDYTIESKVKSVKEDIEKEIDINDINILNDDELKNLENDVDGFDFFK